MFKGGKCGAYEIAVTFAVCFVVDIASVKVLRRFDVLSGASEDDGLIQLWLIVIVCLLFALCSKRER